MNGLLVWSLLVVGAVAVSAMPGAAPTFIGRWEVSYTLNGDARVLRVEATDGGKALFLLRDSRSSLVEPAEPSKADWRQGADDPSVTISGPVEFPIGNVGREPGTLVFKGRFSTPDLIVGDVAFFRFDQDPNDASATPSRKGTFKATRTAAARP